MKKVLIIGSASVGIGMETIHQRLVHPEVSYHFIEGTSENPRQKIIKINPDIIVVREYLKYYKSYQALHSGIKEYLDKPVVFVFNTHLGRIESEQAFFDGESLIVIPLLNQDILAEKLAELLNVQGENLWDKTEKT